MLFWHISYINEQQKIFIILWFWIREDLFVSKVFLYSEINQIFSFSINLCLWFRVGKCKTFTDSVLPHDIFIFLINNGTYLSYLSMVLILWATVMIVQLLKWDWIRLVILASVFRSMAEVASSRISNLELLQNKRF